MEAAFKEKISFCFAFVGCHKLAFKQLCWLGWKVKTRMLKKACFRNVTNFRDRDCDRDSRMAIAIVTAIEFSGRRSWLRLWLEVLWLRLWLWLWLALSFMTVCTLKHRLWLWLKWWLWPSRNANFLWLRFRWLHDRLIISHNRDQFFSSPAFKTTCRRLHRFKMIKKSAEMDWS